MQVHFLQHGRSWAVAPSSGSEFLAPACMCVSSALSCHWSKTVHQMSCWPCVQGTLPPSWSAQTQLKALVLKPGNQVCGRIPPGMAAVVVSQSSVEGEMIPLTSLPECPSPSPRHTGAIVGEPNTFRQVLEDLTTDCHSSYCQVAQTVMLAAHVPLVIMGVYWPTPDSHIHPPGHRSMLYRPA